LIRGGAPLAHGELRSATVLIVKSMVQLSEVD